MFPACTFVRVRASIRPSRNNHSLQFCQTHSIDAYYGTEITPQIWGQDTAVKCYGGIKYATVNNTLRGETQQQT